MPIRLPRDPKDDAFEDLVSAALTAYGYFVETRLILQAEGIDVLEFDTVATPADAAKYLEPISVEVKSGRTGLADIFKLYGQATFTELSEAWLVHRVEFDAEKAAAIKAVERGCCVKAKHVTRQALLDPALYPLPLVTSLEARLRHAVLLNTWWARLADRIVQAKFVSWRKGFGNEAPEEVEAARRYEFAVGESFFKKGPVLRAHALYDAYKDAPGLTNVLAEFHAGVSGKTANQVRQATWNRSDYPWLQHVSITEHRARVRLIKAAYDIKAGLGGEDAVVDVFGDSYDWNRILREMLPASFQEGMTKLEEHVSPHLVPYFFQVFMDLFGGFYFPDDDEDMKLLSTVTGIPSGAIADTVALFDLFFPIPKGWALAGKNSMVMLKGLPAFVRGTGCVFRGSIGDLAAYEDRYEGCGWHMEAWHNALYAVLEPLFKVEPSDESE